jgi:hypothetical protein
MGKRSQKRKVAAVETPREETRTEARRRAAAVPQSREPLPSASAGAFGAYLGMGFGLTLLAMAALAVVGKVDLPTPLVLALFMGGPLQGVLCWKALHRSRVAWSFAVALSGTAALVCLFSAPKIRDALGLSIGMAILPAVVALVVCWLLSTASAAITQRS